MRFQMKNKRKKEVVIRTPCTKRIPFSLRWNFMMVTFPLVKQEERKLSGNSIRTTYNEVEIFEWPIVVSEIAKSLNQIIDKIQSKCHDIF